MLESPVYPAVLEMSHPARRVSDMRSDNPTGADDQQERLDAYIAQQEARHPESSETIRRTPSEGGEDMVRPAWRHAEQGRNDPAPG